MVMLPIFVAGLMATASMAGPLNPEEEVAQSTCANPDPTAEEKSLLARQLSQQPPESNGNGELTLKASFSFCCPAGSDCNFDAEEKGKEELRIMNECYSLCNIKWTLANATKITDERCKTTSLLHNEAQLEELKADNRDGGSEVCNVLYMPSAPAPPASNQIVTKGRCISPKPLDPAPDKNTNGPGDSLLVDSCVVAMDTLPGVKGSTTGGSDRQQQSPPASTGMCPAGADITTVHECGHFLSLKHVGEEQSAGRSNKLRRRQRGQIGNVMDATQFQGNTYKFDESQCPTMRNMARKRLEKGNSTDGSENRSGRGKPTIIPTRTPLAKPEVDRKNPSATPLSRPADQGGSGNPKVSPTIPSALPKGQDNPRKSTLGNTGDNGLPTSVQDKPDPSPTSGGRRDPEVEKLRVGDSDSFVKGLSKKLGLTP